MLNTVHTNEAHEYPMSSINIRCGLFRLFILLMMVIWAFRPDLQAIVQIAAHNSDWTHLWAFPFALVALAYLLRTRLQLSIRNGTHWGVVMLWTGLVGYGLALWPFDYAVFRYLTILPVLAGCVASTIGFRALRVLSPIFLLLLLCVPIGPRAYSAIIIKPENVTLEVTEALLKVLPGVQVVLDGHDLSYIRGEQIGTIALGEPHRGIGPLHAYAFIGVFVVLAVSRPAWQIVVAVIGAIPIVAFCNLIRLITWAIVTIYADLPPTSRLPCVVATMTSLIAAYLIFALLCIVLNAIVVDSIATGEDSINGGSALE